MTDRVLHPFLLASFPVLYLWAANVQEGVTLQDVLPSLALVLAATGAALLAARAVVNDWRKAGLAVSLLVLLFFSYGHVWTFVEGWSVGGLVVGRHRYLLVAWAALAAAGVVAAARAGSRLGSVNRGLNLVALGLVMVNLASVAVFQGWGGSAGRDPPMLAAMDLSYPPSGRTRDIYYIVLDRYGGPDALDEFIGLDNGDFLRSLEARGFYVASESRANYPRTNFSLASSLNMEHLSFLAQEVGVASSDASPLIHLIRQGRVTRSLLSLGYRYVHIASWWSPTADSPLADVTVPYPGLSEFASVLLQTTPVWPVTNLLVGGVGRRRDWYGVQRQFEALAQSRDLPGPKFVFAHVPSPHEPFVFDREGGFVSEDEEAARPKSESYREQLLFVNRKVEELLDVLLAGPEETHPIVILQADEGPYEGPGNWRGASDRVLRRKFSILNAYYLPGVERPPLYPTISPVNSFRVVFNIYLGADLPLLDDRSYVFVDQEHLYELVDVTERVR